ncbi:transporter [Acinetobacter sp. NCu2D-2]|uniref:AEC family transporter n=1 Tax=Acinetobacter sp. NCu2D-2 TaxID=1608473 RepID=UPI0007CDF2F0|nr:AEC family transporter [Acinetobacter sp. NCu2D-2]ANF81830.1 transporter [Acinetobacter sp. NCu2D-2]
MIHIVLSALFPLIALISFGYLLKKTHWLEDSFWRGAEKLNYYVLFPIMLFVNLAQAQIDVKAIQQVGFVAISLMLCIAAIMYMIKRYFKMSFARFGVYVQGLLRFNTYIGLAIMSSLFHAAGLTIFAIVMVICIPVVNVISVLSLTNSQQVKLSQIILGLLKNPLILGCIVGALYNLSGLSLWIGFDKFFALMAACSLPLGLMCVGAALQFQSLKQDLSPLILTSVARLLVMPFLAFVVCQIFQVNTLVMQVMVVFFALPTASASYVLTRVYNGDYALMASVISLQTVLAAFSLPIILAFIL